MQECEGQGGDGSPCSAELPPSCDGALQRPTTSLLHHPHLKIKHLKHFSKHQLVSMLHARGIKETINTAKHILVKKVVDDIISHVKVTKIPTLKELKAMALDKVYAWAADREIPNWMHLNPHKIMLIIRAGMCAQAGDMKCLVELGAPALIKACDGLHLGKLGTVHDLAMRIHKYYEGYQFLKHNEFFDLDHLKSLAHADLKQIAHSLELKIEGSAHDLALRIFTKVHGSSEGEHVLVTSLQRPDMEFAYKDALGKEPQIQATATTMAAELVRFYDRERATRWGKRPKKSDFKPPSGCRRRSRRESAQKTIKLGSWNIRNLSQKKAEADLTKIAGVIYYQKYDMMALQEILDEEVVERLVNILEEKFCLEYDYDVSDPVGRHSGKGKAERYSFIWRKDIVSQPRRGRLFRDSRNQFLREPFCATFNTRRLTWVHCTVHVVFGNGLSDRRKELGALADVYTRMRSRASDPFILSGDFNMPGDDDGWSKLNRLGFEHYIVGETYTTIGDVSQYDNFFLNEKAQRYVSSRTGESFPWDYYMFGVPPKPRAGASSSAIAAWKTKKKGPVKEANKQVSDHRPVGIVMSVDKMNTVLSLATSELVDECVHGIWLSESGTGGRSCMCEPGYRGEMCDQIVEECSTLTDSACNHGTCQLGGPSDYPVYTAQTEICVCDSGWAGEFCNEPVVDGLASVGFVAPMDSDPDVEGTLAFKVKHGIKDAFHKAKHKLKMKLKKLMSDKAEELKKHIEDLIRDKVTHIVVGGNDGQSQHVVSRMAAEHPSVTFTVIDGSFVPCPPNVEGLMFKDDEAGFLAGIIAGRRSISNVTGVITGPMSPVSQRYANGFKNGVLSVCSKCRVLVDFAKTWDDKVHGAELALKHAKAGVDVLFAKGGHAAYEALRRFDDWGIHIIGNKLALEELGSDNLLLHIGKDMKRAIEEAVLERILDKFRGGVKWNKIGKMHASLAADIRNKIDLRWGSVVANMTSGSLKEKLPKVVYEIPDFLKGRFDDNGHADMVADISFAEEQLKAQFASTQVSSFSTVSVVSEAKAPCTDVSRSTFVGTTAALSAALATMVLFHVWTMRQRSSLPTKKEMHGSGAIQNMSLTERLI